MKGEFSGGFERSGKIHETFLLGEVRKDDPEYKKVMQELGADGRGYLPFTQALELTKRFQPLIKTENRWTHQPQLEEQDPANPEKGFPRDLREAIIIALKLETTEDMDRVKYYTAVGSPLDHFHGIDAFVVLEGKNPGDPSRMATFDVTLKTEVSAKRDAKANIIIRELEDPKSKKYLKQLEEIASQAAPFLSN